MAQEVSRLRADIDHLGLRELDELERRRNQLRDEIAQHEGQLAKERRRHNETLESEKHAFWDKLNTEAAKLNSEIMASQGRLIEVQNQIVVTEEAMVLQEAGIYEARHPLADAAAYQSTLAVLRDQLKAMTKRPGGAIKSAHGWTVNGSDTQGRKMVSDFSKLMLRAYNAEADNLVRSMRPYRLATSVERLNKIASTIARLGKTMGIRISDAYHRLRVEELELTADYLDKCAEEKEREREERARLREERKVQQEIENERRRLEKERRHYENALATISTSGDHEAVSRLQTKLEDIDKAIEDVDYRAANVRAGYVYVISNVGSFGERIVKIGLTRRLEPLERIRELGDASVPFKFDVHAIFFSENAVAIEQAMHERLADRRVNRVNLRREFFYVTPAEAKAHLMDLAGNLLHFEELPEALEYHQSQQSPAAASTSPSPAPVLLT